MKYIFRGLEKVKAITFAFSIALINVLNGTISGITQTKKLYTPL